MLSNDGEWLRLRKLCLTEEILRKVRRDCQQISGILCFLLKPRTNRPEDTFCFGGSPLIREYQGKRRLMYESHHMILAS